MNKLALALLCLLLFVLCACGQTVTEETQAATTLRGVATATTTFAASEVSTLPINESNAVESKLYSEEIKRIVKAYDDYPDQLKNVQFSSYDFDGNGIEELLLGWEGWGIFDIYIIRDGVAVKQEDLSIIDRTEVIPPVLLKNGAMRLSWINDDGGFGIAYYRIEDGELKRQITLIDDLGDDYYSYIKGVDKYPGTPITKAEFERLQKEFEGDGQVVELDWKPLAEWGR